MFSGLPAPIPDEHIHSVLARLNTLEGKGDFRNTVNAFISSDGQLNNKYCWRSNYEELWGIFDGILTRNQLLAKHTPFYFDSKFLPVALVERIRAKPLFDQKCFKGIKNIKFSHVWRWCPKCVIEDVEREGSRFWHVNHQIPTLLRCPEHKVALEYACLCEKYKLNKLAKFQLPPKDNICPVCKQLIYFNEVNLEDEEHWLESLTISLLCLPPASQIQSIKAKLRYALNLPASKERLSRHNRQKLKEYQGVLEYLVLDGPYSEYFLFENYNHSNPIAPYCINLSLLIYSDSYFPPLSYIAALRIFYKQAEVEKILLGEAYGL